MPKLGVESVVAAAKLMLVRLASKVIAIKNDKAIIVLFFGEIMFTLMTVILDFIVIFSHI